LGVDYGMANKLGNLLTGAKSGGASGPPVKVPSKPMANKDSAPEKPIAPKTPKGDAPPHAQHLGHYKNALKGKTKPVKL
jgi:hypothetical protein